MELKNKNEYVNLSRGSSWEGKCKSGESTICVEDPHLKNPS